MQGGNKKVYDKVRSKYQVQIKKKVKTTDIHSVLCPKTGTFPKTATF